MMHRNVLDKSDEEQKEMYLIRSVISRLEEVK